MAVLTSVDVTPVNAQVALLDATWQDYPNWESGDDAVAFRAPSLTGPDSPPYPGFAVATKAECTGNTPGIVRVELWDSGQPDGLRLIHENVLWVGSAGVEIGNDSRSLINANVPAGEWALEIWTDGENPTAVSRVVFVLPALNA